MAGILGFVGKSSRAAFEVDCDSVADSGVADRQVNGGKRFAQCADPGGGGAGVGKLDVVIVSTAHSLKPDTLGAEESGTGESSKWGGFGSRIGSDINCFDVLFSRFLSYGGTIAGIDDPRGTALAITEVVLEIAVNIRKTSAASGSLAESILPNIIEVGADKLLAQIKMPDWAPTL